MLCVSFHLLYLVVLVNCCAFFLSFSREELRCFAMLCCYLWWVAVVEGALRNGPLRFFLAVSCGAVMRCGARALASRRCPALCEDILLCVATLCGALRCAAGLCAAERKSVTLRPIVRAF